MVDKSRILEEVIAINIAKILFASLVGYISAFVMVVPAFVMLESEKMK